MVLSADDFRGHIARSPTSILMIIFSYLPRYPQISNPQIALRIEHHVFWLHVAMNNFVLMQVFKADDHVSDKKFSLSLIKPTSLANVVSQIPTVDVVH